MGRGERGGAGRGVHRSRRHLYTWLERRERETTFAPSRYLPVKTDVILYPLCSAAQIQHTGSTTGMYLYQNEVCLQCKYLLGVKVQVPVGFYRRGPRVPAGRGAQSPGLQHSFHSFVQTKAQQKRERERERKGGQNTQALQAHAQREREREESDERAGHNPLVQCSANTTYR